MAPVRFPVHHVDRFFLLFEGRPPPVTCAWVFVVEGKEPEADRLRAAVGHALHAHPKASARLRKEGRWEWETIDEPARMAFVLEGPLEGRDEVRSEEDRVGLIMAAPLDPCEGPLLRVHWIPPGAHRGRLVFRFHHALTDGTGSLVLLRSLLEAYNGAADGPLAEAGAPPWPPAPLVVGGIGHKLRLLVRLVSLHTRHSARHRFALPETLFGPSARASGGVGSAYRRLGAERWQGLRASARPAGAGPSPLLLAAAAVAAERALAERGRSCGMLRVQVTRDLRRGRASPAALENRSSAFPVWIGAQDRARGPELVGLVRGQIRAALRSHAPEGTALFGATLRLPPPVARWLLLPAATRPRIADSLIFTWLGALPPSTPGSGWFHLGPARFVGVRVLVRPPEGVGSILTGVEMDGRLELTLSYLTGLFSPREAERYLELAEASLGEVASSPIGGASSASGRSS